MTAPGRRLRQMLARGPVIAPGAYDALSARLAAQAGAKAVYMTGFGVAGSLLGVPDLGLVSASEMIGRVRALVPAAAPAPLIADGDTGHGGVLNVARLVAAYAQAGAAAVQIEDQVFPKRCGHMAGKAVVPRDEAVARLRAAIAARGDSRMLVIARTDARAVEGLSGALARAAAYRAAGADILFVEAPESAAELRRIAAALAGVPLVANLVEDGKTPLLAPDALAALGFRLILRPVSGVLAAAAALQVVYRALVAGRETDAVPRLSFDAYNAAVGLEMLLSAADRLDPAPGRPANQAARAKPERTRRATSARTAQ